VNKLEQLQSEGEDRFKGSEEEETGGEEGSPPFALGKKKEKSAPTPITVMVISMCICCTCDNI